MLRAAADLLEEVGLASMTMDGVAARAKSSKATLYRHWPSKAALAMDAFLAEVEPAVAFPDTGSAIEDFQQQLRATAELFGSGRVRRMLLGVLSELPADEDLRAAFRHRYLRPRRAQGEAALRRGIDRGELRRDLDADALFDQLYGALYLRLLTDDSAPSRSWSRAVVDQAFNGLAAH